MFGSRYDTLPSPCPWTRWGAGAGGCGRACWAGAWLSVERVLGGAVRDMGGGAEGLSTRSLCVGARTGHQLPSYPLLDEGEGRRCGRGL
jgi:hypothetical protein